MRLQFLHRSVKCRCLHYILSIAEEVKFQRYQNMRLGMKLHWMRAAKKTSW
ncbi:hypothetical protein BofuT4_P151950.1 [Botrytis cinerea T4]|uniref:Uncharacterized protein n=1 Tax=Botryotinia fuckeliana (strain T4) TaxID=999810 RepID=G2YWR5_BOTF4|nr:hypothetical protein BofuT4_P151950.1 [Botrytis cinerea T4]